MTSPHRARGPLHHEGNPFLKLPSRLPSVSPTRGRVKPSHKALLLLSSCGPPLRVRFRLGVCCMRETNISVAVPATPQPPPRKQWYDKLADAILGDEDVTGSPSSRYALICQKCFAHNGLVKESAWQDTRKSMSCKLPHALTLLIIS
jgi:hypothetical protein